MRYKDFDENRDEYLWDEVEQNDGWRFVKTFNSKRTAWEVIDAANNVHYFYAKSREEENNQPKRSQG